MIRKKIYIANLVLFYGFNPRKYKLIKKELIKINNKLFPLNETKIFIIDNKKKDNLIEYFDGDEILKGDNRCFDFTGFDKAIMVLKKRKVYSKFNFFGFANDTILHRAYSDGPYLNNFDAKKIKKIDQNKAIGYIDDFPKTTYLNNLPCKFWIRSNLYFLSKKILDKIKYLTFPLKNKDLFNNDLNEFFKNKYLSKNWTAYMSCWLFNKKDKKFPEYKLNWIKKKKLTKKNLEYFKIKSKTIMSEHYLTSRINNIKYFKIENINFKKLKKNRHLRPYYKNQKI